MQIMNSSTCDTSVIFSGGGPGGGATVAINGSPLVPSPFLSLSVEKYKMGDATIGGVLKLTLNGTVTGDSFNDVAAGIKNILGMAELAECVSVVIECNETLIDGYGRILSVSSNEGNQPTWVNMAPYTMEIELYTNSVTGSGRIIIPDNITGNSSDTELLMLKNISENFSYSINEDTLNWGDIACSGLSTNFGNRHIKLNFSINVAGIRGCGSGNAEFIFGLAAAESYLKSRLESLTMLDLSTQQDAPTLEIISANSEYLGGDSYLDFRTIAINPIENSIEVNGEIIYRPSGCTPSNVFSTLSVEQQLSVDGETMIISGNIVGLVNNIYDDIIHMNTDEWSSCAYSTKIENAELFLPYINNEQVLKDIVDCYKSADGYLKDTCEYNGSFNDDCSTPVTPITMPDPELCSFRLTNSSIGRNISNGEINFTFTLSNMANCEVLGAKKVNVEITHDMPHDNIVEIIIPGRGSKGVLVQNLCCNSAEKVDLSVDATLNRKTCNFTIKQQTIDQLRQCAIKALEDLSATTGFDVSCWFKTNDQESIGNTTYKLSRTYIKPSCP